MKMDQDVYFENGEKQTAHQSSSAHKEEESCCCLLLVHIRWREVMRSGTACCDVVNTAEQSQSNDVVTILTLNLALAYFVQ